MSGEKCAWKRCRSTEIHLTYLGKPLCQRHWLQVCELQEQGRDADARAKINLTPSNLRAGANGACERERKQPC